MWPLPDDERTPVYLLDQPSPPFPPQLSTLPLGAGTARQLAGAWWHLPEAAGPAALARLARPARCAVRRLQQLLGYLWDTTTPVATGALCQRDTRSGHSGVTAYAGSELGNGGHHLFVAGGPPTAPVRTMREITIVSGVCLASARAARLRTESGRAVPITDLRRRPLGEQATALELDPELTVPEVETSARLASVGADLAARIPGEVDVTVLLDVPRTATALHLLAAAHQGKVSPDLLEQWCEAVDERHARVAALLAERWRAALAASGSRPVRIHMSAELETVNAYLRYALGRGRVPELVELVDLVASEDRLWQVLVKIAPPTSALELADLSYAAPQLRAALSTPQTPRLALQLDNVSEHKILRRSRVLANSLPDHMPNASVAQAGLYPLSRLWVRDQHGDVQQALHAHDPGWWAVDVGGRRVNLVGVVADMYPAAMQCTAVR